MKRILVGLTLLVMLLGGTAAGQVIEDFLINVVPLWGDTLLVVRTAADTSGKVDVRRGGFFSVALWTDGVGTLGDSVTVKLDYRFLHQRTEYRTAVAESPDNIYSVGSSTLKLSPSTFYPLLYEDAEWHTLIAAQTYDDSTAAAVFYPPLVEWVQFRVTGNTHNDSTRCRAWVRFEP